MFFDVPLKFYFIVIILFVIGFSMYGGYKYYASTQLKIETLVKNNASYEIAIKSTNQAMDTIRQESGRIQKINSNLQIKLQDAEKYKDKLIQKLSRHNLTKLSAAKPGLIEKRVNDSTTKIFKELEVITALPTISQ